MRQAYSRVIAYEAGPNATRFPKFLQVISGLRFIYSKNVSSIAIQKRRNASIYNAVNMGFRVAYRFHRATEFLEILVCRRVELNRNMDVGHSVRLNTGTFVGEGTLMGV